MKEKAKKKDTKKVKKFANDDLRTDRSIPCKACGSSRHMTYRCEALFL